VKRTWIVVNTPKNWDFDLDGVEVVSAREYLTEEARGNTRGVRVYNLCRSYRHMTLGYYVSLLAEARGHRPLPSIATLQDMRSAAIVRGVSEDLDELIQRCLKPLVSKRFELSIYFGQNMARRYERLATELFNQFPVPLMRAVFERHKRWELVSLSSIASHDILKSHRPFVAEAAAEYFQRGSKGRGRRKKNFRYDIAILHDPDEVAAPSDARALKRFEKAFAELGLSTTFIRKDDYGRLLEYDALFVRETTYVDHHTYRFAARAAAAGLVVIDDPVSIIRCTNKVYLAELLSRHRIATPKTTMVHRDNLVQSAATAKYPCILKRPDSSFSQGVVKAESPQEFLELATSMLEDSELIIAQDFMPTEFDWRVGVLAGQVLYVCRYYMAKKHWQIIDWRGKHAREGDADCVPLHEVPLAVLKTAMRAARLIGDGLYGVDLKQFGRRVVVVEVNDNPSIDAGCEDGLLGVDLYRSIGLDFLRRLDALHSGR